MLERTIRSIATEALDEVYAISLRLLACSLAVIMFERAFVPFSAVPSQEKYAILLLAIIQRLLHNDL